MKPKVFTVDASGNKIKPENKVLGIIDKFRLGVAILVDVIDFLIGWIPVINTLWDFVTMAVLFLTLKEKRLSTFALIELPLIGIPPLSLIDQFIPTATLLTLADIALNRVNR